MFPKNSVVVCGLSGGADSVCLTLCMSLLSKQLGLTVEAVHVNHSIRGYESDHDEEFCRSLCKKLGIKLTVFSVDVPAYAKDNSLSLEEAARLLRYDAFRKCSENKIIATAHNADDNLETSLFNLIRGSGIKGISGIPPVRDNIVRPLLSVTRNEIELFLKENHLDFVTDSSNLSVDYTRNKIRHKIIPLLRELNPSLVKTAVSSLDVLRDENAFIDEEVASAVNNCRDNLRLYKLSEYPSIIRRRCIAQLLNDMAVPYNNERLKKCELIALNGGKLNVSNNLYVVSDGNVLELKVIDKNEKVQLSKKLIIGENSIFEGKILFTEIVSSKNINIYQIADFDSAIYYLDYDKLVGETVLRNRRSGDKIVLFRRNFTSSIKKLINEKVPKNLRNELCFIEDELGTVFAECIGIADRVAPDENTVNLLRITLKHII